VGSRGSSQERDAAAAVRDAAAEARDADWPEEALDHAAMDRLHAADDRAHARADRQQSAQERAQLAHGMERRTVIGQAQGLLMARFGISAEEAYEVLVSQSQHRGDKLHDVAAAVVADHERRVRADG